MSIFAFRPAKPDDLAFVIDSWVDSYRTAYGAGVAPMEKYLEPAPCPHCSGTVWADRSYRPNALCWVKGILSRPGVEVLVAARPDMLAGWICHEKGLLVPRKVRTDGRWTEEMHDAGPVLHYVYVREQYRLAGPVTPDTPPRLFTKKLGIHKTGLSVALLDAAGFDRKAPFWFTHKTQVGQKVADVYAPHANWNPLLCRFPKTPKPQGGQT